MSPMAKRLEACIQEVCPRRRCPRAKYRMNHPRRKTNQYRDQRKLEPQWHNSILRRKFVPSLKTQHPSLLTITSRVRAATLLKVTWEGRLNVVLTEKKKRQARARKRNLHQVIVIRRPVLIQISNPTLIAKVEKRMKSVAGQKPMPNGKTAPDQPAKKACLLSHRSCPMIEI